MAEHYSSRSKLSSEDPERIGPYVVLARLGAGAMGQVYVALDERLDREIAIKLVQAGSRNEASEARLTAEAKALAQVSHPNVVQVFEVGVHGGFVFIAMELAEGRTLKTWLASLELDGAPRTTAILECFVAAGRGLQAVHDAGLAHRDFKPANVIVGDDGRVRVVDFGLASSALTDDGDVTPSPGRGEGPRSARIQLGGRMASTMTDTDLLLGTPRYMSLEQWKGRAGDHLSDQFSFCVALYEAIVGVHPFCETSDGGEALLEALARGRIRAPSKLRSPLPSRVRDALERGLSAKPAARFESMGELLEIIEPEPRTLPRALLGGALALMIAAVGIVVYVGLVRPRHADVPGWSFVELRTEVHALAELGRVEARIAGGTAEQADAMFREFVELPAHAGTRAEAQAWRYQGRRLVERGELDRALDAYAVAYVSSSGRDRTLVLFELARVFEQTQQWQRLGATLATLAGQVDLTQVEHLAELRELRATELASRRDFAAAAAELGEVDRPVLRAALAELSRATLSNLDIIALGAVARPLPSLDLDGDGVGELVVYTYGDAEIRLLGTASASLAEQATVALPGPLVELATLPVDDGGPNLIASRIGATLAVHRLELGEANDVRAAPELEFETGGIHMTKWATGDFDGDGRLEGYAALPAMRRLLVVETSPDGWQLGDPHHGTLAVDSVINDVIRTDVDGDGVDELVVLAAEWGAYDLRILGPGPPSPTADDDLPTLVQLARHKLGTTQAIAALPAGSGSGHWLAVGVSDLYPSYEVFPADKPHGTPGVHVLAWTGGAVEQVALLDLPAPRGLYVGDFDGNGLFDLALAAHESDGPRTIIALQIQAGEFEAVTALKLWPIGVGDLDRDGDHELIVVEPEGDGTHARLFVLGRGDAKLPTLARPELDTRPPLDLATIDEGLRSRVGRAEDLVALGLPLRAAARLGALADLARPELAARLRLRVAELLEANGQRLRAAEIYAEAAGGLTGGAALAARERAMALYDQVHRFAEAASMATAAAELATGDRAASLRAEAARLETLASGGDSLELEFDEALDDRWTVSPFAVRLRDSQLELALGGTEQGVVARREIEWTGGRLALDVELDIELIEWAGGVNVELRSLDDPDAAVVLGVGANVWGGGAGSFELVLGCGIDIVPEPGARGHPIEHRQVALDPARRRFVLHAELLPDGRRWCRCSGEGVYIESSLPQLELRPGRYELVFRGSNNNFWTRARAAVERVTVTGAIDPDELRDPPGPGDAAARAFVEGRPEQALAQIDAVDDPQQRELLRFLALNELGRWDRAEAALREILGGRDRCLASDERHTIVGLFLRHQPESFGPMLRRLCGDGDYFEMMHEIWVPAINQHVDDDEALEVLLGQTNALERWQPGTNERRVAYLSLVCTRARARATDGARGPNRAELERAVVLGDRWLVELDPPSREFVGALSRCRTTLAAELLARGEDQLALDMLVEAIEQSPKPEIAADRMAIDPRLAKLRELPGWQTRIEAVRTGAAPDG